MRGGAPAKMGHHNVWVEDEIGGGKESALNKVVVNSELDTVFYADGQSETQGDLVRRWGGMRIGGSDWVQILSRKRWGGAMCKRIKVRNDGRWRRGPFRRAIKLKNLCNLGGYKGA